MFMKCETQFLPLDATQSVVLSSVCQYVSM